MSATRDPDRLLRAWLDLMPDEAPDRVIASVLQATSAAPQARVLPGLGPRRFPMTRYALIAAVAALGAALMGGAILFTSGGPDATTPATSTPAPSVVPEETPLVDVPGLGRGMGYATTAPSTFLESTWITDADVIQGLFHQGRLTIDTTFDGQRLFIDYGQTTPMTSQVVTGPARYLALVSVTSGSGCKPGDYGDYQFGPYDDGLTITFDPRTEMCDTRASLLTRTWSRSFDGPNNGGRGVLTPFQPMLAITLPQAPFTSNTGNESTELASEALGRTLMALKNPMGWTEPCSETGGEKVAIPTNADAFAAYIGTLPGFTVESEELTLDGYRTVHLTVPTRATDECQNGGPTNGRVIEWGTSNPDDPGFWMIGQGDTDEIYLVEVGPDLYLLQWLGSGMTTAEELEVLSTVEFLDALPTS